MTRTQKILLIAGGCLVILSAALFVFAKIQTEFFVNTENIFASPLLEKREAQREPEVFTVMADELYLSPEFFFNTGNSLHDARITLMGQLIAQGFSGFETIPYPVNGHFALTASGQNSGYVVTQPITTQDTLDEFLSGVDISTTKQLKIPAEVWTQRTGIYLFKTEKDLIDLGYTVVSHRTRISKDEAYRRTNIFQAFKLLGNVRVILPGEKFTFLDDAQYDGDKQENYLNGYAIIENEEEKVYGGGICGASTAIYQGIVTNKSLKPITLRNHSKRFSNLYTATINGQLIKNPGIDSAIYDGVIDLHVQNISNHPIILVMNYDGTYNGVEEIFTLGWPEDQGSIEYVGGYRTSMQIPDTSTTTEPSPVVAEADSFDSDRIRADTGDDSGSNETTYEETPLPDAPPTQKMKTIYGGCHTRIINGVEKKSCYREIK